MNVLKVAVVESIYGIKKGFRFANLKKFSEQQIVDCTYYAIYNESAQINANFGCDGGYMSNTFHYLVSKSLQHLNSYPYVGQVFLLIFL